MITRFFTLVSQQCALCDKVAALIGVDRLFYRQPLGASCTQQLSLRQPSALGYIIPFMPSKIWGCYFRGKYNHTVVINSVDLENNIPCTCDFVAATVNVFCSFSNKFFPYDLCSYACKQRRHLKMLRRCGYGHLGFNTCSLQSQIPIVPCSLRDMRHY